MRSLFFFILFGVLGGVAWAGSPDLPAAQLNNSVDGLVSVMQGNPDEVALATAIGKVDSALLLMEFFWLDSVRKHCSLHLLLDRYGDPSGAPALAEPSLKALQRAQNALSSARADLAKRLSSKPGFVRELLLSYHQEKESTRDLSDAAIDALLGIDIAGTEYRLIDPAAFGGDQVYHNAGLWDFARSTYSQIRLFYQSVKPTASDVVWDLGSGYGRVLLYGATLFPGTRFKGVEIVGPRVGLVEAVGKKGGLKNLTLYAKSALDVDWSDGTKFYLWAPFPTRMQEVNEKFNEMAKRQSFEIFPVCCQHNFELNSAAEGSLYEKLNTIHFRTRR